MFNSRNHRENPKETARRVHGEVYTNELTAETTKINAKIFHRGKTKRAIKKTGVNFYNSFRFFCENYFLFMVLSDHKNVETELLHGYALRR